MGVNYRRKMCVVLVVKLRPADDAEGDDVEPEEQSDGCAKGAVNPRVVGKTGDVPAKNKRGNKPHDGGEEGSRKDFAPGLPQGGTHVVEEGDEADAGGKRDCPADYQRDDKYGG